MALEKSLSKGKSKPKKKSGSKKHKPRHMHIEAADNGGFNVRHQYDDAGADAGGEGTPDSTHALGDSNALLAHVQDQFGGQAPGPAAAGPGAAAAPPAGMQSAG